MFTFISDLQVTVHSPNFNIHLNKFHIQNVKKVNLEKIKF